MIYALLILAVIIAAAIDRHQHKEIPLVRKRVYIVVFTLIICLILYTIIFVALKPWNW